MTSSKPAFMLQVSVVWLLRPSGCCCNLRRKHSSYLLCRFLLRFPDTVTQGYNYEIRTGSYAGDKTMHRVYLDSNATTSMRPQVVAAMLPVFAEDFGNPSSIHWFGQQAKALVDGARAQVARLINAEVSEIVFL